MRAASGRRVEVLRALESLKKAEPPLWLCGLRQCQALAKVANTSVAPRCSATCVTVSCTREIFGPSESGIVSERDVVRPSFRSARKQANMLSGIAWGSLRVAVVWVHAVILPP